MNTHETSSIEASKVQRFECPYCGHLLLTGTLAKGSLIAVKCHNRRCVSRVEKKLVTVAAAS